MSDLFRHIDKTRAFHPGTNQEPRPANNAPATKTILEMCRRKKEAPKPEEPAHRAPVTPYIY